MTLLQEKGALLNRRLEAANAALRAAQDELETARDVAEQAQRSRRATTPGSFSRPIMPSATAFTV
jgi:hypothetical protein